MKPLISMFSLLLVISACSREAAEPRPASEQEQAPAPVDGRATGPVGADPSPEELERMRFDERWRNLQSFRNPGVQSAATPAPGGGPELRFVTAEDQSVTDSLEEINPEQIDQLPVRAPLRGDVSGASVLRAQTLLDRVGFSPGIIDGRWGKNTEIAVWWFQSSIGIEPTGTLDEKTWRTLASRSGNVPTLVRHTLKAKDLEGPFMNISDDVYENAKLDCMCYENVGEKLGEMFHTSPKLLERINRGVDLNSVSAGDRIWVPAVGSNDSRPVQRVVISVQGNYLHGFDSNGRINFHAPTTLGSKFDPSPTETLKVTGIAQDPDFHYQPKLFSDVPDEEEEALLPPGPNSPVGVVWMALSKPHYGIHGTSNPASIGYATSHGCVRLTNWDARALSRRIQQGVKVEFTDTRS